MFYTNKTWILDYFKWAIRKSLCRSTIFNWLDSWSIILFGFKVIIVYNYALLRPFDATAAYPTSRTKFFDTPCARLDLAHARSEKRVWLKFWLLHVVSKNKVRFSCEKMIAMIASSCAPKQISKSRCRESVNSYSKRLSCRADSVFVFKSLVIKHLLIS